jgi:hypothetical protein
MGTHGIQPGLLAAMGVTPRTPALREFQGRGGTWVRVIGKTPGAHLLEASYDAWDCSSSLTYWLYAVFLVQPQAPLDDRFRGSIVLFPFGISGSR